MPTSTPLKSATYLLRFTPEEKADLERRAAARNLTLADALRDGARAYLDEARPAAPPARRHVT
jgi:hypothetical protein